MYKSHTNSIMHLLLVIMITGIFWLLFIELKNGDIMTLTQLLTWMILIVIIPLTLMNFHYETKWFSIGSVMFALVYSLSAIAQLIILPNKDCCQPLGFILIVISMLSCMTIIVLGIRELFTLRKRDY